MKTMKAFRLLEANSQPQLVEMPIPDPGVGEVLIKVGGAGACHSDLHLIEGRIVPSKPFPLTLGHENAGWVDRVGQGVQGFQEGDAVLISAAWGCGSCSKCRMGWVNYCEATDQSAKGGGGMGADGGMAEYLIVPRSSLLVRLNKLDPRDAASLSDATATAYHAVKRALAILTPGSTVVVIGVGGLGQSAVQLLRVLCAARIVAVDTSADKLAIARELGADYGLLSMETPADKIKELTAGLGAEVVIDFVGADTTLLLAATVARKMGQIVLVGLAGGNISYHFNALPPCCSIGTILGCGLNELAEVVALAEAGKIQLRNEQFPLDKAADAYACLKANKLQGRAVITPNG